MRYPCLVRKRDCKTAVKVHLEPEGIGVYGEPLPALELDLTCNYQDSAKTVLTAEKKLVQLSGVALFPGDIAPSFETLSGGTIEGSFRGGKTEIRTARSTIVNWM